jgi:hypothetical protein
LPSNGYVQLFEALRCYDTQLQHLTIEAPSECVTVEGVTVEQKRALSADVLSVAVNRYLSDYFVRTRGRLSSISLVRCCIGTCSRFCVLSLPAHCTLV